MVGDRRRFVHCHIACWLVFAQRPGSGRILTDPCALSSETQSRLYLGIFCYFPKWGACGHSVSARDGTTRITRAIHFNNNKRCILIYVKIKFLIKKLLAKSDEEIMLWSDKSKKLLQHREEDLLCIPNANSLQIMPVNGFFTPTSSFCLVKRISAFIIEKKHPPNNYTICNVIMNIFAFI